MRRREELRLGLAATIRSRQFDAVPSCSMAAAGFQVLPRAPVPRVEPEDEFAQAIGRR
jgi:hypothetical protein